MLLECWAERQSVLQAGTSWLPSSYCLVLTPPSDRSGEGMTWVVPRPEMGDWYKWQLASSEETSGIRQGAKVCCT